MWVGKPQHWTLDRSKWTGFSLYRQTLLNNCFTSCSVHKSWSIVSGCRIPFVGALDGEFLIGRDKLELGCSLADALKSLPHGSHGCICTFSRYFSFLSTQKSPRQQPRAYIWAKETPLLLFSLSFYSLTWAKCQSGAPSQTAHQHSSTLRAHPTLTGSSVSCHIPLIISKILRFLNAITSCRNFHPELNKLTTLRYVQMQLVKGITCCVVLCCVFRQPNCTEVTRQRFGTEPRTRLGERSVSAQTERS